MTDERLALIRLILMVSYTPMDKNETETTGPVAITEDTWAVYAAPGEPIADAIAALGGQSGMSRDEVNAWAYALLEERCQVRPSTVSESLTKPDLSSRLG